MQNKTVDLFREEVAHIKQDLEEHLRQSSGIQSNLKWNTYITGGIAVAIMGRLLFEFLFRR